MAKTYSGTLVLLIGFVLSARSAVQQPSNDPLPKGYYIVVAAFFSYQEDYAQRYSSKLNEGGLHAKYGLDPTRKLYFVYLDQYADFNESVQQMLKVRKEGIFEKAWVRVIKEGAEPSGEQTVMKKEKPPVQKAASSPIAKKEE